LAVKSQQTFTITTSGFQFVPANLTITEGDTVLFNALSGHPIREVSLSTWNANGSTSNGGFNNVMPGTKIKFNTAGTYYYVCQNHFSMGMKGQINVQAANTIDEEVANVSVKAYPSPVISDLNLVLDLNQSEELSIEIFNIIGEQVYSKGETTFYAGKNTLSIDFSDLCNGAYFVKVIGKNDQYSVKVMK
jgi:plastocyanin